MNDDMSMKSVRLPTFGGEHKDFQVWWMRFTAFAEVYGFAESIKKTKDPNLPSSESASVDETTEEGKKQGKAKKLNAIAIANLTMAFTSESLIGMVYQAKKSKWPGGLAYMVVDSLFKKYVPQDLVSKIELRRALNAISMKKEEDPANLFEAISGIENKYNTSTFQLPEEEKIATILENAPAEYSTVLTCEQRSKGTSLKIEDLQEAMNQLYRTMYGNKGTAGTDTEIGLSNTDGGKIICYRCKKEGHKANKCPEKLKNEKFGGRGRRKFGGKCNRCKRQVTRRLIVGKIRPMQIKDHLGTKKRTIIVVRQV